MNCRFTEFRCKEVINIHDGCRLGYVGDVEIDTHSAQLKSIVIYGKFRWLFFGREEDIVVPWEEIHIIGEDTILVNIAPPPRKKSKRNKWTASFREDTVEEE